MATPKADNTAHRAFWASDEADERITLIAEIAANIREDAAPEPGEADASYDNKAKGAELLIGSFVGTRGLVKTAISGSGARVDFETREEALALAKSAMGSCAVEEKSEAPSNTAIISSWPIGRA